MSSEDRANVDLVVRHTTPHCPIFNAPIPAPSTPIPCPSALALNDASFGYHIVGPAYSRLTGSSIHLPHSTPSIEWLQVPRPFQCLLSADDGDLFSLHRSDRLIEAIGMKDIYLAVKVSSIDDGRLIIHQSPADFDNSTNKTPIADISVSLISDVYVGQRCSCKWEKISSNPQYPPPSPSKSIGIHFGNDQSIHLIAYSDTVRDQWIDAMKIFLSEAGMAVLPPPSDHHTYASMHDEQQISTRPTNAFNPQSEESRGTSCSILSLSLHPPIVAAFASVNLPTFFSPPSEPSDRSSHECISFLHVWDSRLQSAAPVLSIPVTLINRIIIGKKAVMDFMNHDDPEMEHDILLQKKWFESDADDSASDVYAVIRYESDVSEERDGSGDWSHLHFSSPSFTTHCLYIRTRSQYAMNELLHPISIIRAKAHPKEK